MVSSQIEVKYLGGYGSDLTVVNAARVSFNKESHWEHDPGINEYYLGHKDKRLIQYLARHKHISPFHHTFLSFRIKAPIFVSRQLVKHEYMPINEVSRRYVDTVPEMYIPNTFRKRPEDKKQGSSGDMPGIKTKEWKGHLRDHFYNSVEMYLSALDEGMCPEQARMFLPLNAMTEWIWSGTLSAFAKMLALRLPEDAQEETREVARYIKEEIEKIFPVSLPALLENYD